GGGGGGLVGRGLLWSFVGAGGFVGEAAPPEARLALTIVGDNVVVTVRRGHERAVIAAQRPEDSACGGDRPLRVVERPAHALAQSRESDSPVIVADQVLPIRCDADVRARVDIVRRTNRVRVGSGRE